MSLGANAIGQASPTKAMITFAKSRQAPGGLPRSGWKPSGSGHFRSGRSTVTVSRLANGTYLVTEANAC